MIDKPFVDRIEELRFQTYSHLTDLQRNLCPMVKSLYLNYQFEYWYEGYKYTLWEDNTHLYAINELPYCYDNQLKNTTFTKPLWELIQEGQVWPFLIFIDGQAIQWSRITVIHDYNYTYLKITGVVQNSSTYAGIIVFPLAYGQIRYGEDSDILTTPDRKGLYFNPFGYYMDDPQFTDYIGIRLEILDPNIYFRKLDLTTTEGNILEFKDLPDGYVPTLENIITFTSENLYNHQGPAVRIKNTYNGAYGLFDLFEDSQELQDIRWAILMYNTKNKNKMASYLYFKEDLNKQAILKLLLENPKDTSEEIWNDIINPLIQTFDFNHTFNLSYKENINRATKYITRYDFSLWKDAFIKNLNIKSFTYTGQEFKQLADEKGYIHFSRDHSDLIEDVILIFVNHKLYKYIIDVTYVNNTINIPVFGIIDTDHIEILLYTECNNNILEVKVQDSETPVYLHPEYNLEDCDLMSSFCPDAAYEKTTIRLDGRTQYIVDYTCEKTDDTHYLIRFDNSSYYGQTLKVVPKRQYRYYRFRRRDGQYKFLLPTQFNYCHDINRYLVFINGKKIDKTEYTVTIMNPNRPFDQLFIYLSTMIEDDDYVDVFYIPEAMVEKYKQESMPNSGMILLEDNENKINYPTTYPLSKYTSMVFINGLKVNPLDIKDIDMNCMLINVDRYERDSEGNIIYDGEDNPIIKRNYVDSVNNITIMEYVSGNKEISGYLQGLYEQIPEGEDYDVSRIDFNKSASDAWKELIKTILENYSDPNNGYTGLQMLFGDIHEIDVTAPNYKENFANLKTVLYDIILDHYLTRKEASTGKQFVYDFEKDYFSDTEDMEIKEIILVPDKDKFMDYDVNAPIASPEDVIEGKTFGN